MQKIQFAIALPTLNGSYKHVTARAYLAALRTAQAHPTDYFGESFCSPRDYITGAGIVRQHWDMVHAKHAAQWQRVNVWGKGSRAAKRAQALRDSRASCKWCGSHIPTERQQFCDHDCRRSYFS